MQDDYVLPGSPLDQYLQSFSSELDNQHEIELTPNQKQPETNRFDIIRCVKPIMTDFIHFVKEFHSDLINGKTAVLLRDNVANTKEGFEAGSQFLMEHHADMVEQFISIGEKKESLNPLKITRLVDVSLIAPLTVAHIIWFVNFERESSLLSRICHLGMMSFLVYFLFLQLRNELLLWARRRQLKNRVKFISELCALFKKCDILISRSLKLVRDISVICHRSKNQQKTLYGPALRESVSEFVRSLTNHINPNFEFAEDKNNTNELELLSYQDERSEYIYQLLINHDLLFDWTIVQMIQHAVLDLEAKLESTRRGIVVSVRFITFSCVLVVYYSLLFSGMITY